VQALFILISFMGAGYFVLKKRRFDCFSLTYISSVFYFTPAYVGFVPTYTTPPTTDIFRSDNYCHFVRLDVRFDDEWQVLVCVFWRGSI